MPTYAIGDIHGERDALDDLLLQVEPLLRRDDTVVFLGDYIDRGPDCRGCINRILALRSSTPAKVIGLLGNHEDWMLRTMRDPTRHSWLLGMEALPTIASYSPAAAEAITAVLRDLGVRIVTEKLPLPYDLFFDAMAREHRAFFEGLALWHRTANAVCTHGGCDPGAGPIERQPRDALIWGGDDSTPDTSADFAGPEPLVYGHWNNADVDESGWPRPRVAGRTIGIDTIARGVLTAIRLPDRRVFQSARQILQPSFPTRTLRTGRSASRP